MTRKLLMRIGLIVLAVIVALKTILGLIGDTEVIANFGTPGTLPNNLMKWFLGLSAWGFFIAVRLTLRSERVFAGAVRRDPLRTIWAIRRLRACRSFKQPTPSPSAG